MFIIYLLFLFVSSSESKSFLDNTTWINDVGYKMIVVDAYNGTFFGIYETPKEDKNEEYKFVGTYNEYKSDSILHITMGWCVSWINNKKAIHSTTVWSGRVIDENTIDSMWLEVTGLEREISKSFNINKNIFKKKI